MRHRLAGLVPPDDLRDAREGAAVPHHPAPELGLEIEVLGEKDMKKLGMDALLGVGMGSAHKGLSLRGATQTLRERAGLADAETIRCEGGAHRDGLPQHGSRPERSR